jgi:nitrite reductase/ring-hydroxylating ferredoxin subunit
VPDPEEQAAERLDRLVDELLRGRRPDVAPTDGAERQTILAAARLAAAREANPRMSARFRRRLARRLGQGEPASWLSRRAALAGGLGLAMGALGGAVAARIGLIGDRDDSPPASPPTFAARDTLEPSPELARWVDSGLTLEDLKEEGVPHRVKAGSIGAYVMSYQGRVLAMSAFCTHLPCELKWQQQAGTLLCPCHNRVFSLQGTSLDPNYPLPPLPMVRVRVHDGRIEVYGT